MCVCACVRVCVCLSMHVCEAVVGHGWFARGVEWLVGWLAGWLVGWLVGCFLLFFDCLFGLSACPPV